MLMRSPPAQESVLQRVLAWANRKLNAYRWRRLLAELSPQQLRDVGLIFFDGDYVRRPDAKPDSEQPNP
jgi:hypothetical protein